MIYSLYKTSLFRKDIYGIILCFFITLLQYVCFYALLREHRCLHFISLFGIIFLCFFVKIPNTIKYFYFTIYTIILFFGFVFFNFGRAFTLYDVCAFLDSDIIESLSFFIEYKYCLFILILVGTFIYMSKPFEYKFKKSYTLIAICLFITPYNNICYIIYKGNKLRNHELNRFYSDREDAKRYLESIDFKINNKNYNIIVVIGESANRNYMSSFGYSNSVTTPELDRAEWIKFPFAVSYDTMTSSCVPISLSYANSYNNKNFTNSFSVIDVLNKLGVETYWISNQSKYGSPFIRILGESCKITNFINSDISITDLSKFDYSAINDGNIPELFNQYFINRDKNKTNVFFIHLYGSHFPYRLRYTDEYEKSNHNTIDEYISSIKFTDMVLSKIKNIIKQEKNSPCVIIYYSDHGEDIGKPRSLNIKDFNRNMVEIPFAVYLSDKFKIIHREKFKNIEKNKNNIFTNDLIYNVILDSLDVTTSHTHNNIYNIFCNEFYINKPLTLHREINILKQNNKLIYIKKTQ